VKYLLIKKTLVFYFWFTAILPIIEQKTQPQTPSDEEDNGNVPCSKSSDETKENEKLSDNLDAYNENIV
jgi:hypothetical protein